MVFALAPGCGRIGYGAASGDGVSVGIDATPLDGLPSGWTSSTPTRVSATGGAGASPAIVPVGLAFTLVYVQRRGGSVHVFASFLAEAGEKLDPDAQVTVDGSGCAAPSVAQNGSGYVVAWRDARNPSFDLYAVSLDASGGRTGADVQLSSAATDAQAPRLVVAGSTSLVAYQEESMNETGVVYRAFQPTGPSGVIVSLSPITSTASGPAAAFDGQGFGFAWADDRSGSGDQVFYVRGDGNGVTTGAIPLTAAPASTKALAMVWAGDRYAVAYGNGADGLHLSTFDATATAVADDPILPAAAGARLDAASLAWTGASYGLAWVDYRDGGGDVYFGAFDVGGALIGEPLQVATSPDTSSVEPALAWNGHAFGLAWHQTPTTTSAPEEGIYFVSLTPP